MGTTKRRDKITNGQMINTVYGKVEIVKVNANSVLVQLPGRTMKITNKQVEIMN